MIPADPTPAKPMSIRRYLGWIMLSALLPMGLFAAALLYFLWDTQQEHRNEEQIARARAIASVVDSEINSTVARLEMLANDSMLKDNTLIAFHTRSRELLANSADWINVLLVSPQRTVMNAALPLGAELPANDDMAYVREAFSAARPAVSDLIVGGVLKTKTVGVAVPVVRNGTVVYVLIAALNLNHLSQVLAKIVLDDGVAAVLDRNFNIVARARDAELYIGQLPSADLLKALQTRQEGITRSTTKDGMEAFSAYTHLTNGWSVGVATPLAQSDRALAQYLVLLVLAWLAVLVLGVALARLMLRRIDRSIASTVMAANALAAGHPVDFPPAAVHELSALSGALSRLFQRERQARAKEEAANRTKDEFLAMLGHELRNPLAPITTALHLMRLRGGDMLMKERGIIERQVQHMVRLVDDLLDVARITRGTVELRRGVVEVGTVLTKAVETVAPLLEQRRLALEVRMPPGNLQVYGDATRLCQIVSNLLTNAAKFTPVSGRIVLSAQAVGDTLEVVVADSGIGMDAEDLARVFELFTQGRQSVDRPHGGLGLGLAIARNLALLHDGELTATSPGRDQGSSFRLTLPLLPEQAAQAALAAAASARPPAAFAPPTGEGLVLVVDDNVDAALLLKDLLDSWGYTTRIAHDGPQALQLLQQSIFNAAVLDIGLPGMDGYELAEHIRKDPRCAGMRLIALTGYGQEADRRKTQEAGFDTHLVKPVDVQLLAGAL